MNICKRILSHTQIIIQKQVISPLSFGTRYKFRGSPLSFSTKDLTIVSQRVAYKPDPTMMLLIGMKTSFTIYPINPMMAKPIPHAIAIFLNSLASGLVHIRKSLLASEMNSKKFVTHQPRGWLVFVRNGAWVLRVWRTDCCFSEETDIL